MTKTKDNKFLDFFKLEEHKLHLDLERDYSFLKKEFDISKADIEKFFVEILKVTENKNFKNFLSKILFDLKK